MYMSYRQPERGPYLHRYTIASKRDVHGFTVMLQVLGPLPIVDGSVVGYGGRCCKGLGPVPDRLELVGFGERLEKN